MVIDYSPSLSVCHEFILYTDVKGINEFWLTAMKNVDMINEMIQVGTLIAWNQEQANKLLNVIIKYATEVML